MTRRVRARRRRSTRHPLNLDLFNALVAPDPSDTELAEAWWANRHRLAHPGPLESDEPFWAWYPGIPDGLRVRLNDPDARLLDLGPDQRAQYDAQAERADAQMAARRAWLRSHPEALA